jgi:phage gp36-like protein
MWREITEDDVLAALNFAESSAYQTAVVAPGQYPLDDIIKQVVQECRAHIADCQHNTLAPGDTLPERVIYHVVALIRFRMITRLDMEVSDDRRREQRDAIEFFRRVSECKVAIEPGDGSAKEDGSDSKASPRPGIKARSRNFSRDQQAGI